MTNRFCLIIPHYNHHRQLPAVLTELRQCALPGFLVDDGSDADSRDAMAALAAAETWLQVHCLPENRGKGAAVIEAFALARSQGFTHGIQIDADGQHEIGDLEKLVAESRQHPHSIVSGMPVFGEDIPKSRLHGRKLTTFCVAIETLSRDIDDAMCGYRVYPIEASLTLCRNARVRPRMQFDTEILVRWHWQGGRVRFVRTPVRYPEDGLSHFKLLRDNVHITLMHTRLILGMIVRLPGTLVRRMRPARPGPT